MPLAPGLAAKHKKKKVERTRGASGRISEETWMTRRRVAVFVLLVGICIGIGRDANAQDTQATPAVQAAESSATIVPEPAKTDTQRATNLLPDVRKAAAPPAEAPRSPVLTFLYGFTAGTQIMDIHSTRVALEAGAYETNPFMKKISVHTSGLIATKAAMTIGTIFLADRIARHHKTTAIVSLIAVNVGYVYVVHHNYEVSRRLR
jgi:hypothetical protein